MDGSMIETLPPVSSLSPSLLSFLNDKLYTTQDLQQAPNLASELQNQCHVLDQSLADLNQRLGTSLVAYSSHSDQVRAVLADVNSKLSDLQSSTGFSGSTSSDGGQEQCGVSDLFLGKELPALANEVARVEAVRIYADIEGHWQRRLEFRILKLLW